MGSVATKAYIRPRAYVRVKGPDAADLLQRLVSNDVLAARVVRGADPDAEGPRDRAARRLASGRRRLPAPHRARARRGRPRVPDADADRVEVRDRARGAHLGDRPRRGAPGSRRSTTACPPSRCSTRVADAEPADDELERLRILARTPRWGREIDEGILPAEAGLDERAVSFTKGCFPGQEPVARLHNRGHANRALRVLEVEGDRVAPPAEVRLRRRRRRPRDELGSRASRSPTFAPRCPRAPSSRSQGAPPGYTDRPRARSSGDRALPCGGRGRKFESCRAHPGLIRGRPRLSGPSPARRHRGRSTSPRRTSRCSLSA